MFRFLLKTYKPQDEGKMKVRALVKEFKDQCKCNISTTKFGPEDLKKSSLAMMI